MKRVVLMLVCLLIVVTLALPALAFATAATPTTTTAATTSTAGAQIVYPTAPPDATAAEARASTQWAKPGDLPNLAYAVLGLIAGLGIVAWGIFASRKVTAA